jgi:hypothetical protein
LLTEGKKKNLLEEGIFMERPITWSFCVYLGIAFSWENIKTRPADKMRKRSKF